MDKGPGIPCTDVSFTPPIAPAQPSATHNTQTCLIRGLSVHASAHKKVIDPVSSHMFLHKEVTSPTQLGGVIRLFLSLKDTGVLINHLDRRKVVRLHPRILVKTVLYSTSPRSVPWIAILAPSRPFFIESWLDAYIILVLMGASSGDLSQFKPRTSFSIFHVSKQAHVAMKVSQPMLARSPCEFHH